MAVYLCDVNLLSLRHFCCIMLELYPRYDMVLYVMPVIMHHALSS